MTFGGDIRYSGSFELYRFIKNIFPSALSFFYVVEIAFLSSAVPIHLAAFELNGPSRGLS
jgi:hypothetical protein